MFSGREASAMRFPRKNKFGAVFSWQIVILFATFFALTQAASAQFLELDRATASVPAEPADPPSAPSSLLPWMPLQSQTQFKAYKPITPEERLHWFLTNTFGPQHLAGGIFAASLGTAFDRPKEYGPHWNGFLDRYDTRLTGIATSNAIEASVGYLLREDPRYFGVRGLPFGARVRNVVRLTFMARREDGSYGPAYARYLAISGNNILSDSWRVRSEDNLQCTLVRTAAGFAGRMASNAFEEFWPSMKWRVFRKGE
jgi:hypothetical protein